MLIYKNHRNEELLIFKQLKMTDCVFIGGGGGMCYGRLSAQGYGSR